MVVKKRIHVVGLQYLQKNLKGLEAFPIVPMLMFETKKVRRRYLHRTLGFTDLERLANEFVIALLLQGL